MHVQHWFAGIALGLLVLASGGTAWSRAAPDAGAAAPRVEVRYHDPHAFSETREFPLQTFDHGDYLQQLRTFLVERTTPMLRPGERLAVTFSNIKLAGSYEPWRGVQWQDVRFMRNIYPPRMTFHFELTGPDGKVVRAGERRLVGTGYLYALPVPAGSTDPLRYDKALLSEWLRRGPQRW